MLKWMLPILISTISISAYAEIDHKSLRPLTKEQQQTTTPQYAIQKLRDGNKRFIKDKMHEYDYGLIRELSAEEGQFPFAFILSCIDSRSVPDITFDQPLGNIFVGRVAGNVTSTNMLGSMEFSTQHAGAKIVVVMGHTGCGAVQGACSSGKIEDKNLTKLLREIKPAVKKVKRKHKVDCTNADDINEIAKQNVINQVHATYKKSATIKSLVKSEKVILMGAMHDIQSGKVDFFYHFKP